MSTSSPTLPWSDRPASRRFADVFLLGLAAAIATGLVHALGLAVSHFGFDKMTWYPRGFFWMSPVAYTLVMLPGALLLGLLALTIRKPWVLALSVFAVATVGAFGLLLPATAISRAAALVLAAGIGTTVSRLVMKRSDRWISWSRRLVVVGIVGVPTAALLQGFLARPDSAVAAAEQDRPPNILLVVMDVVRASSVTLNQPELSTTPGLARRGAEGVVFEWALTTAPWTLPSHASMFTGLYARQQDGDWYKPLQDEAHTLTETLRDRGYATGGFVSNLHYTAWDTGLAQGFDHYEDYTSDWLQIIRCSSYTQTALFTQLLDAKGVGDVVRAVASPDLTIVPQHTYRTKLADRVTSDFLRWQDGLGGRPFFALINLMDAHLPHFDPEPLKSRYPPAHRDMRAYDGAIRFVDEQLDSAFNALDSRGELDRTILVVTSDHGDLFEQHGLSGHANSLYLDLLHVPLMIRYPARVPAGVRIAAPVSLRDLSATLIDLSGGQDSLPGASLRNAWEGKLDRLSPVLAEVTRLPNPAETPASQGDMRALFDDSLHYIVNEGTRREELYAYRIDPAEARNLIEGDSARLQPWRDRLARVLREVARPNDPR